MEPETRRSRVQRLKAFNRAHPMVLPAIVGIALYVLLGFFLWGFISPEKTTQKKDFAQLMAQIAGGLALLFGLYFTWRRVEISQRTLETQQDQQVTERFTRAIDQLGATDDEGKPKLEIRLGGIYALERIAKDSPRRDSSTVMEVLTAYVRENASSSPKESSTEEKAKEFAVQDIVAKAEDEEAEDEEHSPIPADIRAISDVLRRAKVYVPEEYRTPYDLHGTHLYGANLGGANLQRTYLRDANLRDADLQGAYLYKANLQGAELRDANLQGASLQDIKGLTQGQLEQAIGDKDSILPEGLELPKSWSQG